MRLWSFVERECAFVHDVDPQAVEQISRLQALYGQEVLPPDFVVLFNVAVNRLHHAGEGSIEDLRRRLYKCLFKLIIIVDEAPVSSRLFYFWVKRVCSFADASNGVASRYLRSQ